MTSKLEFDLSHLLQKMT